MFVHTFPNPHIAGTNFSGACKILLIVEIPNSGENDQSIRKMMGVVFWVINKCKDKKLIALKS